MAELTQVPETISGRRTRGESIALRWKERKKGWQLYVLMLLPFLYLMIFRYYPMLGAQIAFRDYNLIGGVWGSPWAGLKHFARFINSYMFSRLMANTLILSFYQLIASFPLPILLALSLNYLSSRRYRKTVQMATYAPHFISLVVLVGLMIQILAMRNGLINNVIELFGGQRQSFLGNPDAFRHLYVWSTVWQNVGYSSIIYIATLTSIDPELHEAAIVDGATILQRIRNIDIPGILPTAVILLILSTGRVLELGFEKAYLLQNPLNLRTSEIIQTYVYKQGLLAPIPQFSYAAAIGLFRAVIGLALLTTVNAVSRRVSESSLW
ncbi:MAG TPA: ABC transporter permease subunit [Spirochaetia bacterium]|nr:ABC transporter permease subunit [Spirochaetia bacterium]